MIAVATILLGFVAATAPLPPPPQAEEPLKIPPPPAIPGAPAPPEDPIVEKVKASTPEELEAHQAAADASPRVSNFADHHATPKPSVPAAPVRRRQEIKLFPSEAMIVDRGAMSESLRVPAADLRVPTGFSTIYEVDQRPDVLVRANGAIFAVFPQGDYALGVKDKRPYIQTLVSPGTVFYIGEPNWRRVWLPGVRGMMPKLRLLTADEFAAQTPPASALDRVEPTMPHDYDSVYVMPVMMEEFPGIGLISTRIETFITPAERAFGLMAEGPTPTSYDESVPHPVFAPLLNANAAAAEAKGDGAAPPIHTDALYRRGRLGSLLERAAKQGALITPSSAPR